MIEGHWLLLRAYDGVLLAAFHPAGWDAGPWDWLVPSPSSHGKPEDAPELLVCQTGLGVRAEAAPLAANSWQCFCAVLGLRSGEGKARQKAEDLAVHRPRKVVQPSSG
jgi:hypothetical protein